MHCCSSSRRSCFSPRGSCGGLTVGEGSHLQGNETKSSILGVAALVTRCELFPPLLFSQARTQVCLSFKVSKFPQHLFVVLQPCGVESAFINCLGYGAARLNVVLAIAKAAVDCKLRNVRKGFPHSLPPPKSCNSRIPGVSINSPPKER